MFQHISQLRFVAYAGASVVAFVVLSACTTETHPAPVRDCSSTADCKEITSLCAKNQCIAGRCLEVPANEGTVVEEGLAGDCHRSECDGSGNVVSVVDDLDKPMDTDCMFGSCLSGMVGFEPKPAGFVVTLDPVGDCQQLECDGAGKVLTMLQEADVPVDVGACFTGTCSAGVPGQTPKAAGTVIEDPVPGDCQHVVCDGAGKEATVAYQADVPNDMNGCTNDLCVQGMPTHSPVAAGTLVDNGVAGDCQGAQCDGMGNMVIGPNNADAPSDAAVCTVDACNAGVPVHTPKATGTSCGNGGAVCHPDGRCDACTDPGANCPDNGFGEPNDSQATANDFGTVSDADSAGKNFCAVLSGPNDVDWFTYHGSDDLFSEVDPFQTISNGTAGRLCVFFKCDSGTTTIGCSGGSTAATAPGGQSGCCATAPFPVTLECSSVNDHAQVWLRVDNPNANACVPYQLSFHY